MERDNRDLTNAEFKGTVITKLEYLKDGHRENRASIKEMRTDMDNRFESIDESLKIMAGKITKRRIGDNVIKGSITMGCAWLGALTWALWQVFKPK